MKFSVQGFVQVEGVVSYPVDADVNLPYRSGSGVGQIKSDDVGIKVVLQVSLIDLQQIFIRAKDIVERFKPLSFFFKQGDQEGFERSAVGQTGFFQKVELNGVRVVSCHVFQNS